MKITLFGKRWDLRFVSGLNEDGDIDRPDVLNKQIRINKKLRGKKKLEVILHEALHGCDWHRDEEWITHVAEDLSTLLWRLGYRQNDEKEVGH